MKVAIASNDRFHVDTHLGKAQRFLICELNGKEPILLEERKCKPLSVGDPGHAFDAERFDGLLAVIADCEKVFITHIGRTPAARLRLKGIEPVTYDGPIASITV
jgi:predicted Fe-Mo cluster-binding NifX family protein